MAIFFNSCDRSGSQLRWFLNNLGNSGSLHSLLSVIKLFDLNQANLVLICYEWMHRLLSIAWAWRQPSSLSPRIYNWSQRKNASCGPKTIEREKKLRIKWLKKKLKGPLAFPLSLFYALFLVDGINVPLPVNPQHFLIEAVTSICEGGANQLQVSSMPGQACKPLESSLVSDFVCFIFYN